MKRTPIKRIGKKGKEWLRNRKVLIEEAVKEGLFVLRSGQPFGQCLDCLKMQFLTPDHRRKRSLGGSDDKSNIDWICLECHNKRDNMGDPNKKKETSKKPDWMRSHPCKKCKKIISFFICPFCKEVSI